MTDTPARTANATDRLLELVGAEAVSRDTDDAGLTLSAVPVVAQHSRPDSRRVDDALLSTSAVPRQLRSA